MFSSSANIFDAQHLGWGWLKVISLLELRDISEKSGKVCSSLHLDRIADITLLIQLEVKIRLTIEERFAPHPDNSHVSIPATVTLNPRRKTCQRLLGRLFNDRNSYDVEFLFPANDRRRSTRSLFARKWVLCASAGYFKTSQLSPLYIRAIKASF